MTTRALRRSKSPMAAWIKAERERMNLTAQQLAARMRVSENTVRVWEGRVPRPPGPDNIERLEVLFDSRSPAIEQKPSDQSALVAALEQQTTAITRLVEEMQLAREEQARWNVGVQRVVESLADQARAQPTKLPAPPPLAAAGT